MANRHVRGIVAMALCCVCLSPAAYPQAPNAPQKHQRARAEYERKAKTLDREQVNARIALAQWCIDKRLLEEAQEQLQAAAATDPVSERLLPVWAKLTDRMPRKKLRVMVTLDDGNMIHGVCSPKPFLLKHEFGVLLVPMEKLRSLARVMVNEDDIIVKVTTPEGVFTGLLTAPALELESSLGKLTLPFKIIQRFAVEGADEPDAAAGGPLKPGEAALNWDQHIAQLRAQGLDVVIVFDSTGSMDPPIRETKRHFRRFMTVVSSLVPNARVGLVTYRDKREFDPEHYEYTTKHGPLTGDVKALEAFLSGVKAWGGHDIPEAVYEGLALAMGSRMRWRPRSRKVIILFGDAPPRPENDGLRRVRILSGTWHRRTRGVVHAIDTGEGSAPMSEFKDIAEAGGGTVSLLGNDDAIIRQLLIHTFGRKWEKEVDKAYKAAVGGP